MDIYKETFETWNKIASLYEEKFMYLDIYNDTYDFFCDSIEKENAKVLDLGCGPGNITKYLLAIRPDFHIEGIDISPNMIDLAYINNPGAVFRVLDSRNISSLEGKFDGIISGFCLPYLSEVDCKKLIADAFNLLNQEGVLYLSFVEGDPGQSGFQVGSTGDRVYFYFHLTEKITRQLIEIGFEKPTVFKFDYEKADGQTEVHVILVTRKE